VFVSYRFFTSGSQIDRRLKRQSKLLKTKGVEGGMDKKCEKLGDTQIPSDMGIPFWSVSLSSFR